MLRTCPHAPPLLKKHPRPLVALARKLRRTADARGPAQTVRGQPGVLRGQSPAHGDVLSPTDLGPKVAARDGPAARLMPDVAASIPPTLRIALAIPRLPRLHHRTLETPNLPQPGRMVGHPVRRDDPIRDALPASALDPTRGTVPSRKRDYRISATIIAGSYAGRPCPSARYAQ